jgi:hypothetical protein
MKLPGGVWIREQLTTTEEQEKLAIAYLTQEG